MIVGARVRATIGVMPPRPIAIEGLPDLRDVGGRRTPGGRVRARALYRAGGLSGLAGPDAADLARLGIRTVYDLRTADERAERPGHVPRGARCVAPDVLRDADGLARTLCDPTAPEAVVEHAYRQLVALPSALDAYKRLFHELAQRAHRPALLHCTTGADRTGWAVAALLLLLGVAGEDVMADYLLVPTPFVRREYLEAAIDEMQRRHRTIDVYFATGLGLGSAGVDELRAALVLTRGAPAG